MNRSQVAVLNLAGSPTSSARGEASLPDTGTSLLPESEKQPLDFRLAGAALGVWFTSWGALRFSILAAVAFTAVCVASIGGLWWARRQRYPVRSGLVTAWVAVAVGALAGTASCGAHLVTRDHGLLADLARQRAAVTAEVVVRDDPRAVRPKSVHSGRSPVQQTYLIPASAQRLDHAGRVFRTGGRLVIFATGDHWQGLLPGQMIRVEGRLARPRGGDLTAAVLTARGPPDLLGESPWIQRAAGTLRAGLQRACADLPPAQGGLLPGLVIGDTSRLEPEVDEAFRAAGMTHLVAVSGSNVALVCGLVFLLARWCRVGPRTAAVLAAVALVGFVILVRPSPSVLRAAAMGGLGLLALVLGRPRAALPALATSVLVLVLLNPALAASPGFALSVCATSGLLLLAPAWARALRRRGVPPGLAEVIAVPAAAQVACAPLIAALSGTVSVVAIPANALAVPATAPATVLGVIAAVVSPVTPAVATFFAWLGQWPAWWLVQVAKRSAAVPGAVASWPDGLVGALLLPVVLVAGIAAVRWRPLRRAVLAVVIGVAATIIPVRAIAPPWPPAGWVLVGCDVGQGDALALRAGEHAAVMVDVGPEPAGVDRCLRQLGINQVPLILLSHPHTDHIGGLPGVLRGRTVSAFVVAFDDATSESAAGWEPVVAIARRHGIALVTAQTGEEYVAGEATLGVLGPVRHFRGTRSDPNNNSLVVRAEVNGVSILLPGDIEEPAQRALLEAGELGDVNVLKVPHHGSRYTDSAFLDAAHPQVAVVEVGADNDYGHPNATVLAHLERLGARILRTDQNGDVAVIRDRRGFATVTRR